MSIRTSRVIAHGACLAAALAAPGQGLPRYRFDPGDHLVYERRVERSADSAATDEPLIEMIRVYALDRRDDDVLVLVSLACAQGARPGTPRGWAMQLDSVGRRSVPEEWLPELDVLASVLDVLPPLPTALQRTTGWTSAADPVGNVWRCGAALPQDEPGGVRCYDYSVDDGGERRFVGGSQSGRFWFDAASAVVVRAETALREAGATTTVRTRLLRREKVATDWCARRRSELSRYLAALRIESAIIDEATANPGAASAIRRRLERVWDEFLASGRNDDDSPLRDMARGRLGRLAAELPRLEERTRLADEWIGRRAADWSFQDPAGTTIRSEDVRDRPTLEFFWSGASLASLRMLPVLRELRGSIAPESLRIICLNIDDDLMRAGRAIEAFGDGLDHVLAGPPMRGEAPTDLPVIRVLDRDGVVRRVIIGWRRSLVDDVKPYVR